MTNRAFPFGALALSSLLVLGACGGDGPSDLEPTLALAVGSWAAEGPYGAYELTTNDAGGEDVDWLALGASIILELDDDGTTSGHLFVPGADEDGADIDMDLAGRWTASDGVIELEHEADTFLRDMPLTLEGGELVGEETFGDTTVRVRLARR